MTLTYEVKYRESQNQLPNEIFDAILQMKVPTSDFLRDSGNILFKVDNNYIGLSMYFLPLRDDFIVYNCAGGGFSKLQREYQEGTIHSLVNCEKIGIGCPGDEDIGILVDMNEFLGVISNFRQHKIMEIYPGQDLEIVTAITTKAYLTNPLGYGAMSSAHCQNTYLGGLFKCREFIPDESGVFVYNEGEELYQIDEDFYERCSRFELCQNNEDFEFLLKLYQFPICYPKLSSREIKRLERLGFKNLLSLPTEYYNIYEEEKKFREYEGFSNLIKYEYEEFYVNRNNGNNYFLEDVGNLRVLQEFTESDYYYTNRDYLGLNNVRESAICDEYLYINGELTRRITPDEAKSGLIDLPENRSNFNSPQLRKKTINIGRKEKICNVGNLSIQERANIFENQDSFLQHLRPLANNVVVAGGYALSHFLSKYMGKECGYSDIDLFLYDCYDNFEEVCKAIMDKLMEVCDSYSILDSENCITIKLRFYNSLKTVQIIKRVYKSPSHIIHGFDVDCCCILIELENLHVYATKRGDYSIRHRTNVLNFDRLSKSYSYRLLKYNIRKFNIYIPEVDYLIDNMSIDVNDDCELESRYITRVFLKSFKYDQYIYLRSVGDYNNNYEDGTYVDSYDQISFNFNTLDPNQQSNNSFQKIVMDNPKKWYPKLKPEFIPKLPSSNSLVSFRRENFKENFATGSNIFNIVTNKRKDHNFYDLFETLLKKYNGNVLLSGNFAEMCLKNRYVVTSSSSISLHVINRNLLGKKIIDLYFEVMEYLWYNEFLNYATNWEFQTLDFESVLEKISLTISYESDNIGKYINVDDSSSLDDDKSTLYFAKIKIYYDSFEDYEKLLTNIDDNKLLFLSDGTFISKERNLYGIKNNIVFRDEKFYLNYTENTVKSALIPDRDKLIDRIKTRFVKDYSPFPHPMGFPGAFPMGFPGAFPMGFPGAFPTEFPGAFPTGFPGAPPTGFPGAPPMGFGAPPMGFGAPPSDSDNNPPARIGFDGIPSSHGNSSHRSHSRRSPQRGNSSPSRRSPSRSPLPGGFGVSSPRSPPRSGSAPGSPTSPESRNRLRRSRDRGEF